MSWKSGPPGPAQLAAPGARPAERARRPHGQPHLPALDGARGLAILLVLTIHLYPPASGLEGTLRLACWCGVGLFFVLSGFLITGLLLESKGSPHYFRNFYMRRALRIFPLYYAALAVLVYLLPASLFPDGTHAQLCSHQAWLWLYGLNFWMVLHNDWMPCGVSHFWSLAVEEQFYLFWPLLVFWLRRRALCRACMAILLAALGARVWLVLHGHDPKAGYVLPVARMDAFAVGALVSLALRQTGGAAWLSRWSVPAALTSALLLLGLVWQRPLCLAWHVPATQALGYTLIALFFGGVLARCVTAPPRALVPRVFNLPPLRWLGKYSYGIYVFHFPLVYLCPLLVRVDAFPEALRPFVGRHYWHLNGATVFAASLLLAFLSWHLFEKHFLKLKAYFPRGDEPGEAPVWPRFFEAWPYARVINRPCAGGSGPPPAPPRAGRGSRVAGRGHAARTGSAPPGPSGGRG
jgi:peptidoglycan/LPS O-acetylase OafA/YrhL